MREKATQRKYRDRLFVKVFSDKDRLLSLYNAVNGTSHKSVDGMTVNTIDDVIYVTMRNDVSFLFHGCLSLYEHQSTPNPNMPLRGLLYFARFYNERHSDSRIYSTRIMKIPSPRFVVFYNGSRDAPDISKLRLSDMFEVGAPKGEFEWTATVLNINYGRNETLMSRCKPLRDYSDYVRMVEENKRSSGDLLSAVTAAVDEAIRRELLDGYFRKWRKEAIMDCLTEFDEESYKKVMYEDGYYDGMDKGIEKGIAQGISQGRAEAQAEISELKAASQARIAELEAELAKYKGKDN